MASPTMLSETQNAALDALKAELEQVTTASFTATNVNSQVITRSCMLNNGVAAVKYHDSFNWSGSFIGACPPNIQLNHSGKTSHKGVPPKDTEGSVGAIIYVGPKVQGGPDDCAWVLAWSAPGNKSGNKIYVESGPSSKYPKGSIDWESIKKSLDNSTYTSYSPPNHGAEATAKIDEFDINPSAGVIFAVNNDD